MKRRGIRPEAIRRYWVEGGIKSVDMQFSWENLYSMNRDLIDDSANRYFFVEDPQELRFHGIESLEAQAPLHPDHPERGVRKIQIKENGKVYVTPTDRQRLESEGMLRLKDLCNVSWEDGARYAGDDLSVIRDGVGVVQWVSEDSVPLTLLMPSGETLRGLAESALLREKEEMVQLERVGFVRVSREKKGEEVSAIFAHR